MPVVLKERMHERVSPAKTVHMFQEYAVYGRGTKEEKAFLIRGSNTAM